MQTSSARGAHEFAGHSNSHGGPQFLGNHFDTSGAPIYIDSNAGDNKLPATICELPDSLLSPYFTGRDDELQQIENAFSTSLEDLPGRCIIHGMPGLGKTQLALRFAKLAFQRSQYAYVFWVSAASTEKLSRDFSKLVDLLRLPGRCTSDQVTKLTMARAWLEDTTDARSWIIILDNVNQETTTMLRDMLPRRNGGGKLLFTTRTAKIAEAFATSSGLSQLALQPPGIQDAVAMLSACAGLERDGTSEMNSADAAQVIRSVGALPLAIDQAASYLKDTGNSVRNILELYKAENAFEFLEWENDLSLHEEKSVAATFTPALNKILMTAPDVLTLLRVLSFCNPESIPISIFTQGCSALHRDRRPNEPPARALGKLEAVKHVCRSRMRLSRHRHSALHQKRQREGPLDRTLDNLEAVIDLFRSEMRLFKAIQEVQRLSLATCAVNASERTIRIHDLIHLILRSRLMTDADRGSWLEAAIRVVCKALEEVGDYRSPRNWNRYGQLVSHVESLETFAEQYKSTTPPLLEANTSAAMYLNACGFHQKAAVLDERTVDQKKAVLGEDHPGTLMSMAALASAYGRQGRFKKAEELEMLVIEKKIKVLGQEHLDTFISKGNLATTYKLQGRNKEAEELLVLVIKGMSKELGQEDPHIFGFKGILAAIYAVQGRWKEAEKLGMLVIKKQIKVLGEEHPDTLMSLSNLAWTYCDQGRWKEAEELQVRVIETSARVLGQEHPKTLWSMNNLPSIYGYQGRWKEAEELALRMMKTVARVLGQEHPNTLSSMGELSWIYVRQGRWKEAEELQVRVIETSAKVLGQEHPSTLWIIGNLASTYANQGRWKKAEELQVRMMKTVARVLGQEHPNALLSMGELSLTYCYQGLWKEAEELQVRVLETMTRVLGEEHPNTLTSMNNLAITIKSQGRNDQAIELMHECVELRRKVLGKDHPHTKGSLKALHRWEDGESEDEETEDEESEEEEEEEEAEEEEAEEEEVEEVGTSSLADLTIA